MAINQVNANNYAYQVISNTQNQRVARQNLFEKPALNDKVKQEAKTVEYQEKYSTKADEESFAQVSQEYMQRKPQSTQIFAYNQVQNQDKREQIRNMVGISVYA